VRERVNDAGRAVGVVIVREGMTLVFGVMSVLCLFQTARVQLVAQYGWGVRYFVGFVVFHLQGIGHELVDCKDIKAMCSVMGSVMSTREPIYIELETSTSSSTLVWFMVYTIPHGPAGFQIFIRREIVFPHSHQSLQTNGYRYRENPLCYRVDIDQIGVHQK
jgi:hypothetical protein